MCENKSSNYQANRDRITHEYDLINNRINWMLTSQTLFFGIYALLITSENPCNSNYKILHDLIPLISLTIAILVYLSVLAAIFTIRKIVKDNNNSSLINYKLLHSMALLAPVLLPLLFIFVWLYIIFSSFIIPIITSSLVLIIVLIILLKTHVKN